MPLKVVRSDITKMNTEAIVNTANSMPLVGPGCDLAVYQAAGYDRLLELRKEFGIVEQGEVFITEGLALGAKYIIHAVSPRYIDGESGEEIKLRSCYRKALELALEYNIQSIAFPLISTGSFGYPKTDGLRIAMDEINAFLIKHEMDVTLVVFDSKATGIAARLYPELQEYIDQKYVTAKTRNEYESGPFLAAARQASPQRDDSLLFERRDRKRQEQTFFCGSLPFAKRERKSAKSEEMLNCSYDVMNDFEEGYDEDALKERIGHIKDPFGVYFFYLVESKGMSSQEVQNGAWITKQVYHKIKKNPESYHPDKKTALRLCVALKLNLDEAKDFIARAGYAFSSAMLEDIIWQFGIENSLDIFDMSDLMESRGFPPLVDF